MKSAEVKIVQHLRLMPASESLGRLDFNDHSALDKHIDIVHMCEIVEHNRDFHLPYRDKLLVRNARSHFSLVQSFVEVASQLVVDVERASCRNSIYGVKGLLVKTTIGTEVKIGTAARSITNQGDTNACVIILSE